MVVPTSPPQQGYVNSTADFEKWIRMATDNKINTTNSWDLALIDYFYDLSVLRDGDGINFQKASATLDGCVKIYASRVDSAATETGRLISGLAARRNDKAPTDNNNASDDEDSELDEMDPDAPQRLKKPRSHTKKDTLVDFKTLQLKKMDMELNVDPLFKKALADFDEGGSKSLLLNMLHVDPVGKMIFDTTDSAEITRKNSDDAVESNQFETSFAEMDIDRPEEDMGTQTNETLRGPIMELGKRFLSSAISNDVIVCPSIAELRNVVDQKGNSGDLLKELENIVIPQTYDYTLNGNYETTYQGFDISFGGGDGDDMNVYDNDDMGEGDDDDGMVPPPLQNDENNSRYPGNRTSIFFNDLDDEADDYGVTMRMLFGDDKSYNATNANDEGEEDVGSITNIPDEDLLAYFDDNQRKNWAGPDHWKVTRIKRSFEAVKNHASVNDEGASVTKPIRKPKERTVIDFLSNDNYPDPDSIFNAGTGAITLPKAQWNQREKNVLPDDRHFTTRNFITLFTKQKLINSRFNKVKDLDLAIDQSLYAATVIQDQPGLPNINNPDFFNDYNDYGDGGDGGFDDYDDNVPTSAPQSSQLLSKSQGSQLPLNYSRVSKKVDIKLLKDNLWETLEEERKSRNTRKSIVPPTQAMSEEQETLKFSELVDGLGEKYDPQAKRDLSTSFCFICLLHLANENGFTIDNNNDNSDLIIKNFASVN